MNKDLKKEENEELDSFVKEHPNFLSGTIEQLKQCQVDYLKQREKEFGKLGFKREDSFPAMYDKKYSTCRYIGDRLRLRFTTTYYTNDALYLEYQGEEYLDYYSLPIFTHGFKIGESTSKTIELLIAGLESKPVDTIITLPQLKELGLKTESSIPEYSYSGMYEISYDYMLRISCTAKEEQKVELITNYFQKPDLSGIKSIPLQTWGNLSVEAIKNLIEAFDCR